MRVAVLAEGDVYRGREAGPAARAVTGRSVVARDGALVASAMLQSGIGQNDAMVHLFRSEDLGVTWAPLGPVWPEQRERSSIFANLSRGTDGELFLFGTRTPRGTPGESFVHPKTFGLKPNELIWARSGDDGRNWSAPAPIPMPVPGSAEAPGTLLATRRGRWLVPYAPYTTWTAGEFVDQSRVMVLGSDDRGRSWPHAAAMLTAPAPGSTGNEQWVVELTDGRLLGAAWHCDLNGRVSYPNMYALSHDGGLSWGPTRSAPLVGQSIALTALPDDRVVGVYNVRTTGTVGVWIFLARPDDATFGLDHTEVVWRADAGTRHGTSGQLAEGAWLDFTFGEPSVTPLPDGTFLVLLWYWETAASVGGIRWVRVKIEGGT